VPLTLLNGWALVSILQYFQLPVTIFTIAALLSFILDYPVQLLQRLKVNRTVAVLAIIALFLGVLATLSFTLAPVLIAQLNGLVRRWPIWIGSGIQQLQLLQGWADAQGLPVDVSGLVAQLKTLSPQNLQTLPGQLFNLTVGTFGNALSVLLTVVLTIYFLLYGDRFWEGVLRWLPDRIRLQMRQSFPKKFKYYYIGQFTVSVLMGLSLTALFFLLQVPFWLLFGVSIGVATLVPFGDLIGIILVGILVALKNFGLGAQLLVVAIAVEQLIQNGIAPRLVGGLIGLNPIWVIVSLLIGAKLGGILGLLLAIPVAGSAKNVVDELRNEVTDEVED
jgi:predicted PurR-regulated permease PerM